MIERFLKSLAEIPEHLIALSMIGVGAAIALLPHLPHAYETGTALTASGLAMYKGKKPGAQ
jgi:hypothetical protein